MKNILNLLREYKIYRILQSIVLKKKEQKFLMKLKIKRKNLGIKF